MTKIGTIINFCSLDYRLIRYCVRAAAPISSKIVVPYADHLFDGSPEDMAVIARARKENPEAEFVPFAYHHSITEMLRSRFWHNFARWVGLSHLSGDCDWVLFLDADEIVESDRFAAFLLRGGFEAYDYLYFANYWYFREPRFCARQIEDSPAMVKRAVINVNRIFHEKERATFRRLPNGLRRVAGPDGRPMFHHYSWVMTEAEMLKKVRTWGHSLDTDKDWETLVKSEFSGEFSGKDFVHGYDFDSVKPLIRLDVDPQATMAARAPGAGTPDAEPRGKPLRLTPLAISLVDLMPLSHFLADPDDLVYFLDTDFKEHYRLLAYLSTLFAGETLIDIGTYKGYSALALAFNPANLVVSYDIADQRRMHTSKELDNIEFRIGDILSDVRLLHAPLIFIDIDHNGASERRIYNFLDENGYEGLLVIDDIHLNSAMASFWENIPRPKQDITELGHVTGTGIVYFSETGAGESISRPVLFSSLSDKEQRHHPAWTSNPHRKAEKSLKKMRIGFHSNQLGLRGTDVALYDYAFYNREILGHESIIFSDARGDLQGLAKFQKNFEVILYDDFALVEGFVEKKRIDAVYLQKAGHDDGKLVSNAKNLVHAVFQSFEPHGDVYAYISRWLAHEMTGGRHPFVPYIVRLPETEENFRKQLGIPDDAVVFGRHGGRDQFSIPFAQRVVFEVARARPDLFFLFMNTDRFCEPRANIIHLNPTWDLDAKVAFINTCDAMLHARIQGETFGLAIAEFLLRDKPVIASREGIDKNHQAMLGERGLFYREPVELFDHLIGFEKTENRGKYRELVAEFSPQRVMKQFEAVFLEGHP